MDDLAEPMVERAVEFPVARVDLKAGCERRTRREKRRRDDRRRHGRGGKENPRAAAEEPGDQEPRHVFREHREREHHSRPRRPPGFVEGERGHEERRGHEVDMAAPKAFDQREGIPVVK